MRRIVLSTALALVGNTVLAAQCLPTVVKAVKTHDDEAIVLAQELCAPLVQAGSPEGLYAAGLLRLRGLPAPVQETDGTKLLERAAEAGSVDAQARLGRMYLVGERVERNPATAVAWFARAAEQGSSLAHYELGQRYYKGEGVAQNDAAAYRWFSLAVLSSEAAGDVPRSKLAARKRETLHKRLSSSQRREAEVWVADWRAGKITRALP